jgi:hypothetical protein
MSETNETLLVASLLARPDLIPALRLQPALLRQPTARAVLKVLVEQGPAFAAPGPMLAALQELPDPERIRPVAGNLCTTTRAGRRTA